MTEAFMLDTGPLGKLVHPRIDSSFAKWVVRILGQGAVLIVPEIADYELRRNLLLEGFNKSIRRLNELKRTLVYAPLSTAVMLNAAELWAEARRRGRPTAGPKELDGDVILAAQAKEMNATVLTENVGHLSLFVEAKKWTEIEL